MVPAHTSLLLLSMVLDLGLVLYLSVCNLTDLLCIFAFFIPHTRLLCLYELLASRI